MLFKNIAGQKAIVYAYDGAADAAKTGDAANITATISKDGGPPAASSDVNPTEVGGGLYAFDLSQAETNCDLMALVATSATAHVRIDPVVAYTPAGAIPMAPAGASGGLPTVNSQNYVAGALALGVAERGALADTILGRDVSTVQNSAGDHSLCYVILAMSEANTVDHPNMLTVYKTDGVTEFARKGLRTLAGADPITGVS